MLMNPSPLQVDSEYHLLEYMEYGREAATALLLYSPSL